jgi:hypothetical protein
MKTDAHSRALLNISFGVPSKGTLPRLATFTDQVDFHDLFISCSYDDIIKNILIYI